MEIDKEQARLRAVEQLNALQGMLYHWRPDSQLDPTERSDFRTAMHYMRKLHYYIEKMELPCDAPAAS